MVLLVEGHAAEAAELLAEARYKDPESFRLRAFEAEVLRVSKRFDRAVDLFRQLLGEVQGTDLRGAGAPAPGTGLLRRRQHRGRR